MLKKGVTVIYVCNILTSLTRNHLKGSTPALNFEPKFFNSWHFLCGSAELNANLE